MIRSGIIRVMLCALTLTVGITARIHSATSDEPAGATATARIEMVLHEYVLRTGIPESDQRAITEHTLAELAGHGDGLAALTTGYRGLVMGALATCHILANAPESRSAAQRLFTSLHETAWDPTHGLSQTASPPRIPATIEDQVELIHGLIDLYSACGQAEALTWAAELQDRLDHDCWRSAQSAYGEPGSKLPRTITGWAAWNLIRLARITDDDGYAARASAIIAADVDAESSDHPAVRTPETPMSPMAFARAERDAPVLHLTLIGRPDEPGTTALLSAAHRRVVPGFAIAILDERPESKVLRKRFPAMPLMPRLPGGSPTAYLCTANACDAPTQDLESLARRIAELAAR